LKSSAQGFVSLVGLFGLLLTGCTSARARVVPEPAVPAKPARLTMTRFMAYGDSITEGFVQQCPGESPRLSARALLKPQRGTPAPTGYPRRLQTLLSERYPAQMIEVANEGSSGEDIQAGAANLPRSLTTGAPQVLLLQEGINTINAGQSAAIAAVVDGLRTMIREARSRGIVVFVGTLLPQRPGGCRAYDLMDENDDVIAANVLIRTMVGDEGARLVDLYEAFVGQTAILLGQDGLHPSEAGYQHMAESFFAAITASLEE
jgi:lysophospholipase L1-like esterase